MVSPMLKSSPVVGSPLGMSGEEGNATLRDAPILEEIPPPGFPRYQGPGGREGHLHKVPANDLPPQHAGVGRVGC